MSTLDDVFKRTGTTYRCDRCRGTFDYVTDGTWDADAAREEAVGNGFAGADDMVIICDDCYQQIMEWRKGVQ